MICSGDGLGCSHEGKAGAVPHSRIFTSKHFTEKKLGQKNETPKKIGTVLYPSRTTGRYCTRGGVPDGRGPGSGHGQVTRYPAACVAFVAHASG